MGLCAAPVQFKMIKKQVKVKLKLLRKQKYMFYFYYMETQKLEKDFAF